MARTILNPFDPEQYRCIGCSPSNPIGLHLQFYEEGDEVFAHWNPDENMQGYINVLHGGIQTTLMDEIASWTVYIKLQTAGVTESLSVDFHKPVYINKGPLTVRAKVSSVEGKHALIETGIYNSKEELCASGKMVYFIYPQEVARRRLHYPGIEAFYEK
ncbi:MAG: PaaI family thioesterase [Chlorobi bacterium]|nr:PaaI family thioesterase [Chlorobiota bacterium]